MLSRCFEIGHPDWPAQPADLQLQSSSGLANHGGGPAASSFRWSIRAANPPAEPSLAPEPPSYRPAHVEAVPIVMLPDQLALDAGDAGAAPAPVLRVLAVRRPQDYSIQRRARPAQAVHL